MEIYNKKKWWKFFIILGATLISAFSLIYTNILVSELKEEEQKKVELWAEANKQLVSDSISGESLALVLEVIRHNTTVPVIVIDNDENIILHRNVKISKRNSQKDLLKSYHKMKKSQEPFVVKLNEGDNQYIYYGNSILLTKLRWFPIIQLLIIFVFMTIAYVAFSVSRKWEQDRVWVGMARETAHQLGTPTTSLFGWLDVLKMNNVSDKLIDEMRNDIKRLEVITSRFSKIGSQPELFPENIEEIVTSMVDYLKKRTSNFVKYNIKVQNLSQPFIPLSRPLIEWAVENICKNALDAMEGEGDINITISQANSSTIIDITDSGKGMVRTIQNNIFKPGFSTKQRGWGLGLALSKRIVEQYHRGTLSIPESNVGVGTTFRIILPTYSKSEA